MGALKGVGKLTKGLSKLGAKVAVKTGEVTYKGAAAGARAVYENREAIKAAATTSAKVAGKTVATVSGLAYKGAAAAAKTVYDNRQAIRDGAASVGEVAKAVAKATGNAVYKAGAATARTAYSHREEAAGAVVGVAKGTADVARSTAGHLVRRRDLESRVRKIESESHRYRELAQIYRQRLQASRLNKPRLLDTLCVGGETLASYVGQEDVPEEIQRAYELAYPNVAASLSFGEQIDRLGADQLIGFVSGIKGKLFELRYVDYLNDGNLPSGFSAELARSATEPGWDIAIRGPSGWLLDTIQAKATDSASYVKQALDAHPHIDVVTTSEVHASLLMQGFAENVLDSGISEAALNAAVEGAVDGATLTMSWFPSPVALALIAFSVYGRDGLSAYEKSREFGERSAKSYLAYLAGGALAVASNTWWIGVLGGMGSRFIVETGRRKRQRAEELDRLIVASRRVNRRLASVIA